MFEVCHPLSPLSCHREDFSGGDLCLNLGLISSSITWVLIPKSLIAPIDMKELPNWTRRSKTLTSRSAQKEKFPLLVLLVLSGRSSGRAGKPAKIPLHPQLLESALKRILLEVTNAPSALTHFSFSGPHDCLESQES